MPSDRPAPLAIRTFVDDHYENWRVYEVVVPADAGPDRSLIFESDRLFRRVKRYPSSWEQLSIEELRALSWRC
ncbi:MAG: hypothetical protein NVS1B4_02690 [Gemmatimonadaceae bacterium]